MCDPSQLDWMFGSCISNQWSARVRERCGGRARGRLAAPAAARRPRSAPLDGGPESQTLDVLSRTQVWCIEPLDLSLDCGIQRGVV